MKFTVTFERQVIQQAQHVVEMDVDEMTGEDYYILRWKARRDFDPRTADWITVDTKDADMGDAEKVE